MSRRRTVADWREAVFRSAAITDSVRVVLLFLAEHMRENRQVSVPRKDIARNLGRSERKVSQRIADAHAAGFLDTIQRGRKGHTAVYVGLFPDVNRVTVSSTLSDAGNRHPINGHSVTPGGPTSSRANLSVSGYGRNGSTYEEQVPTTAAAHVTDSATDVS